MSSKTSFKDLYLVRRTLSFAGLEMERAKSIFSIIGVPLDSSASHRTGQRLGPLYVREASLYIESSGFTIEGFIEDVLFYDEGDLAVVHGDVQETLDRLSKVVAELLGEGKYPIVIGGEHTVTVGVLRGLKTMGLRPCIVIFDAHFDLRYDYLGVRYSHACTFRRSLEILGDITLAYIGVRAYDKDEILLVRSKGSISYITPRVLETIGISNVIASIRKALSNCDHIYVSIDMDVYDPSYAPGVGNPEPGGLSPREVLPMITAIIDERLVGLDIVEVTPQYDINGASSVLAAKTLQEALIVANLKVKATTT
ncbi:MAG: agmatinase [Acidilobaceae archaeon]